MRPNTRWFYERPLQLALLALILRIGALLLQGHDTINWDGANFARTAENVHKGLGYVGMRGTTNLEHEPLYPLLIAAVLPLYANAENIGIAISLLAGALFVVPLYLIARLIYDERVALIAAVLAAVHPFLIKLSVQVLTEPLYYALAAGGIYALLAFVQRQSNKHALVCGALFGLAYLTRSEGFLFMVVAVAVVLVAQIVRYHSTTAALRPLLFMIVPFAVCAIPYVAFFYVHTGQLRIENKTAENYAIGIRLQAGMSYVEAADGLGPGLREDGPELGGAYYATHQHAPEPSLGARLQFAVRAARSHVRDIGHYLSSVQFGSPLLLVMAIIGLFASPWTAKRLSCESILIAYALANYAALSNVQHFWDRYAAGFIPYIVLWGAKGFDEFMRWATLTAAALDVDLQKRRRPFAAAGALLLLLVFLLSVRTMRAEAISPELPKEAAAWIERVAPGPKLIMDVSNVVAYYAQGTWNALPYSSASQALAYVHLKKPDFVVLDARRRPDRPYLGAWLDRGIPDPAARLVHTAGSDPNTRILVYRWLKL